MLAARQFLNESSNVVQKQAKAKLELLNQERVCQKKERNKRVKFRITFTVVAILLVALTYTAMEAKITMYGYEINTTKLAIADIENDNAKLLLQVEELSSPERIAAYAVTELGMVQPTADHILYKEISSEIAVTGNAMVAEAKASSGMDTVVPTSAAASIEVIEGKEVHPVVSAITKLISQYKSALNSKQMGMLAN
ncbi:MAG: hypothetical protein PHN47_00345 [Clostridia bacterium]|nr:hypothetical protein [Clostridia bacterium]MDD4570929.1 hypothetical protein [Clostridia bacterium]